MEKSHRRLAILALLSGSVLGLWGLSLEPDAALDETASAGRFTDPQRPPLGEDALVEVDSSDEHAQDPSERESITVESQGIWSVVKVLVTDTQGPVANAIVQPDAAFQAHEPSDGGSPASIGAEAEFATGEDGTVVLELRADLRRKVHVTHEGLSWAQQCTWRSARAGSRSTLEIRLLLDTEESELLVRSAPSGAPIRGALVSAGSMNTMTVPVEGAQAISNDRGVARLPVARRGARDRYRISVAAEGHSKATLEEVDEAPEGAPSGPRTIWLKKHASLSGTTVVRVTESQPSQVGSAQVLLIPQATLQERTANREAHLTVPDWVDARANVTDGITYPSDRVIDTANVKRDGSWALESVKFPGDVEERSDLAVILKAHGVTRVLARNLSLHPGDVVLVEDPWWNEPSLHLDFTLDDGRPASDLGKVVLTSVPRRDSNELDGMETAEVMVAAGEVLEDGALILPALPRGRWRWELRDPRALGLSGTLDQDGSATTTWRLEGYSSVRGRVEVPEARPDTASRPFAAFRNGSRARLDPIHWRTVGQGVSARAFPYDEHGNFRIPLVPVGETIQITANVNLNSKPDFDDPGVMSISVGTGEYVGALVELRAKVTTERRRFR